VPDYALDHDLAGDPRRLQPGRPQVPEKFLKSMDMVSIRPTCHGCHREGEGQEGRRADPKTLMALFDMQPYESGDATFAQVCSAGCCDKNVDGVVVTMPDRAHIDEYLRPSGATTVDRAAPTCSCATRACKRPRRRHSCGICSRAARPAS
jgi:hypothetical protein